MFADVAAQRLDQTLEIALDGSGGYIEHAVRGLLVVSPQGMPMDIISTISSSITLAKRLREISKHIEDAEFKNLLADLSNELADVKLEAAALKERLAALQDENALLKKTAPSSGEEPSGRKWGCYQFAGQDGLYCPACWDSKRKKSSTTRVSANFRHCPVCNAPIGAG